VYPRWEEIAVAYDGKIITGCYRISRSGGKKKVVVKSVRGSIKEAPLKGVTPLYLAKMLLRELEREGRT
jgi:hypothetical protein